MIGVRRNLEVVTNVAILVVCGAILWTYLGHKARSLPVNGEEASLEGTSLSPLPGYNWSHQQGTLILAIRKGCHFCENSLPFYKRLSTLHEDKNLQVHVMVVMPDDKTSAESLLRSAGVSVDGVFDMPLSSLHVSATPTILLVNAKGRVDKAWVGQLSQEGEGDVISHLK